MQRSEKNFNLEYNYGKVVNESSVIIIRSDNLRISKSLIYAPFKVHFDLLFIKRHLRMILKNL